MVLVNWVTRSTMVTTRSLYVASQIATIGALQVKAEEVTITMIAYYFFPLSVLINH
jgi:hypothetical protein